MDESAELRQRENWLEPGQYVHSLSLALKRSKRLASFYATDRWLEGEQELTQDS